MAGGILALIVLLGGATILFAFQSKENKQLADEAQKQATIALARQLASQAQSISDGKNTKEMISVLLAIESMHLFPSVDAFQVLQKKMFFRPVSVMSHTGPVFAVDFSPDGKYVVSGGCDIQLSWFVPIPCDKATAQVWDAATGKEIADMTHSDAINSVVFSSDGKYVVSASYDGTARVWEALTGKEIARMNHDNAVKSASFRPDGMYVVTASADGTARVWEAVTGKEVTRMKHEGWVLLVAFSPDGKYVVSGSYDSTARIWEAATGKEIARTIHDDWITSLTFSRDGKYVVSGSADGMARIWEAMNGKEIGHMIHRGYVSSVAISPDGKNVISGSYDGTARVWEATTGKEIARMDHEGRVTSVAFSSDGKYIVSGGCDQGSRNPSDTSSDCGKGTLRIWEVTTGKEIARMLHNDSVTTMAFTTDKKYVVSGDSDGTVRVWSIGFDYGFFHITDGDRLISVVFGPGGKYALAAGYDNTYQIWDVTTGKDILHAPLDSPTNKVVFSADGKYVASKSSGGMVRVWDIITGKEISPVVNMGGGILRALSPNGEYVALADLTTAQVWEVATGKEIARMKHDDETVQLLAFSPDGKYLVSESCFSIPDAYSCQKGFIRVWEVATGKEMIHISHDNVINSLAISPDGKYMVTGGCDQFDAKFSCSQGIAHVWEALTGKEIAHVAHDYAITSVAFSSDGKYVASGGCDQFYAEEPCSQGTARVWEAMTGKEIARGSPDNGLLSVTFSPNDQYLVFAGTDGTVYKWLYQPEDLIGDGCTRVTRNLTRAEWELYIGDILPYQAICDNLPIEPEPTATP